VQLALDLLEGLVEAHSKGIVHRDIKPSNIFLSQKFGAKLLDFGIAKLLSSSAAITAKGVTLGTPRYMAPEQACGRTADCRSDLYALGVILFELVAGEHPFAQAQTPVEMLIAQAGWEPPALFIGDSSHNDEFVALINSLLSKDPKDRPPTAVAARDYVRGLLSKLELSGSGVEYSPLRTNESVNMTTPVAEETRKLPVARVARSSQHRRKIGIGQEALIPGHRETNVRRRSWRPAIATTLVAIAILSASSLTKPYPIPGILSNVWFSVLHSSAKLNSSKTLLARSAAKHNTSNNGQAAPPQAVLEEEDPKLGELSRGATASGYPGKKSCAASSQTLPKRVNSAAIVEHSKLDATQVLRPNEKSHNALEVGRDQSRLGVEYEGLTRR
jgi:serine/threonine protein kinase